MTLWTDFSIFGYVFTVIVTAMFFGINKRTLGYKESILEYYSRYKSL